MCDVVREAGQANDSAVHYHFGSRDGLLLAICEHYVERMEPARHVRSASLFDAIADLVHPTAELLRSEDGRQFLNLMAQLAGLAGVRTGTIPAPMAGTALLEQLDQIQSLCAQSLPARIARERVAFMIGALTSSLADRARMIDAARRPALGHDVYVANLVVMLVAGLEAPGL